MATRKVLFIVFLCAVTLIPIMHLAGGWGQPSNAQSNNAPDRIAIRDALRRGGLREVAKLKGHYVLEHDPHWDFGLFDLESLTKNSTAVIVGVPTKKLGERLVLQGELILTNYEVSVQEVIKGDIKLGETVTVGLIGGHIQFEDGTSVEVRTPEFEHMKPGGTYAIFLSEVETTPGTYTLTGGPQGLVQMNGSGKVKSHGRESDLSVREIKDKGRDDFLKDVRQQAKRWPYPGKCCN